MRFHLFRIIEQQKTNYNLITTEMLTLEGMTMHTDVVLKNEGSMVKTCRNINVHVVNKQT